MIANQQARLGRVKWHCRRALLELDLLFQAFWSRQGNSVDQEMLDSLERLLALEDHDLWDLLSGRTETEDPRMKGLVCLLRRQGGDTVRPKH